MRLHALTPPLQFEFQALSFALSVRDSNGHLWIVRDPDRDGFYLVCQEAEFGEMPLPLTVAFFGVFVETDRFSDPIWRINLGPGIWPVEEE